MNKQSSLPETLQYFSARGYQFTDLDQTGPAEDAYHADDWRLDAVQRVPHPQPGAQTLVIAVSSQRRRMKMVFTKELLSQHDFSPLHLLKRLFPQRKKTG
jgi:hypothetical protein